MRWLLVGCCSIRFWHRLVLAGEFWWWMLAVAGSGNLGGLGIWGFSSAGGFGTGAVVWAFGV